MKCRKGGWFVRYGEWIEVCGEEGTLLASFKVPKDMCKEGFDIYLAVRHDISVNYSVRRRR